jgi:hypothetical protein
MNAAGAATAGNNKPALPAPLLTKLRYRSDEAAEYLAAAHGVVVSARSLDKWRCTSSNGPEFQKFGRAVLYTREALDGWAIAKLGRPLRSTSEAP